MRPTLLKPGMRVCVDNREMIFVRRDAQPLREGPALRGLDVERTGDHGVLPVECRADAVHRADLAALTAADHAPVQSCHGWTCQLKPMDER